MFASVLSFLIGLLARRQSVLLGPHLGLLSSGRLSSHGRKLALSNAKRFAGAALCPRFPHCPQMSAAIDD